MKEKNEQKVSMKKTVKQNFQSFSHLLKNNFYLIEMQNKKNRKKIHFIMKLAMRGFELA